MCDQPRPSQDHTYLHVFAHALAIRATRDFPAILPVYSMLSAESRLAIMSNRNVILVQLPIPPVGPQPIRGNVPLAAGYLKLFARLRGLDAHYNIEILPTRQTNTLSDQGLVEA